jgi:hypothetical protein
MAHVVKEFSEDVSSVLHASRDRRAVNTGRFELHRHCKGRIFMDEETSKAGGLEAESHSGRARYSARQGRKEIKPCKSSA